MYIFKIHHQHSLRDSHLGEGKKKVGPRARPGPAGQRADAASVVTTKGEHRRVGPVYLTVAAARKRRG
jgi:hypothetical protein